MKSTEKRELVIRAEAETAGTAVLKELQEGNKRFSSNYLTARDFATEISASTGGQTPKAIILSCLDSRVPVELIFDQGIGDLFVGRVAGNTLNDEMLGSIVFGDTISSTKLIVVLGHQNCGAVEHAILETNIEYINSFLDRIKPAIDMSKGFKGEKTRILDKERRATPLYLAEVCRNNVTHTVNSLQNNSFLKASGIKIVGGVYSLTTGKVEFL